MASIGFEIPKGACDCHTHVFPDDMRFPYSGGRKYTPPFASIRQLSALMATLQMQRVVVVQPSVYGSDNSATLHAVQTLGRKRARAVAIIDDRATVAQLDELHDAGVRGVRLNLEMLAQSAPGRCKAIMKKTAQQIAGRGWHIQIYSQLKLIAEIADVLGGLEVPIVLDHFACVRAEHSMSQPGFPAVLDLLKADRAYVKVSAPYLCSKDAKNFANIEPMARSLIEANAERILWGSNWPHPNASRESMLGVDEISPAQDVDDANVLSLLSAWAPDAVVRRKILVDNPQSLYDF